MGKQDKQKPFLRLTLLYGSIALILTIGTLALLINIFERKQEAKNPFYRVVDLTNETEDPSLLSGSV